MGRTPPEAETIAGLNITFLVFVLLAVLGVGGAFLAVSPYEPPFKIGLFLLGSAGSLGSFLGLRQFHLRRVRATGDPRTTVYSAFAIYSALLFCLLFAALALIIFGRFYGLLGERLADLISYFLITDIVLLLFMLGVACAWDMARPGVLAKRIYLWPWSYLIASLRPGEPPPPDSRNDADRNDEHHDEETHGEDL